MPSNQNTIVLPLSEPSFKSYVIRALIDWCEDEGLTPYMLVAVDDATRVPREFVNKDGTIVSANRYATSTFRSGVLPRSIPKKTPIR